jgi:prepilin-type N-terminal cleavage/methylation domain-containing protein
MLNRLLKGEEGFTLIELLVTIAILGVLFGITSLTLSGVGSNAQTAVCSAEIPVVQSAMDIYMAVNPSNTIAAQGTGANISAGGGGFTDYLRRDTVGEYTWALDGASLAQTTCP